MTIEHFGLWNVCNR